MQAAARTSPVGHLVGSAGHHAVVFGLLIAFGELAVGIGTVLGLWTRAAAAGGMALSLSFLLTVSWHTSPYYLGPDIVFLFAFTPLAIAGPGPWSVDAWILQRLGLPAHPGPLAVDEHRRRFLETLHVATWVAVAGLAGAGVTAALGRILSDADGEPAATSVRTLTPRPAGGGSPSTSAAPTITAGPGATTTGPAGAPSTSGSPTTAASTSLPPGTAIGAASEVPVGGAAQFVDPGTGRAAIVAQPSAGRFEACSAICTHQGCTVAYAGNGLLHCPCHGAEFEVATGVVVRGPARQPLPTLSVAVGGDGNLYVAS